MHLHDETGPTQTAQHPAPAHAAAAPGTEPAAFAQVTVHIIENFSNKSCHSDGAEQLFCGNDIIILTCQSDVDSDYWMAAHKLHFQQIFSSITLFQPNSSVPNHIPNAVLTSNLLTT